MNKAVIFDLDGTILDTFPDIYINIDKMLRHFGYPAVGKDTLRRYIGNGARELVRRSLGVDAKDGAIAECLDYYNKNYTLTATENTVIFDGMEEVFATLSGRGYKLAVLTNKPQVSTDRIMDIFFRRGTFAEIVGGGAKVKCKPDKTETLNILSRLGVAAEDAYFVGDGETDVMTALNAGVRGVAVLWGYRTKEELTAAGAKIFAKTPADLLKIID